MIPLFSIEQVRDADNFAVKKLGFQSSILMENAAISVVNEIFKNYPYLDLTYRFGIICGKGNNGGDGFAVARHLILKGFTVNVILIGNENDLVGDALLNYNILKNLISDSSTLKIFRSLKDLNSILSSEIIIDALLGTGSKGALKFPYDEIISKINNAAALRISIDVPTGLDLNIAEGKVIFNSNFTITLAALKTGLYYGKGKLYSGKVVCGSIGIGNSYFDDLDTNIFLIEPEDASKSLPIRKLDDNKYSSGKVLTIAGSSSLPGAAVFSMNASMMSGAGAGILAFPKSKVSLAQAQMNSAVVFDYDDNEDGYLKSSNLDELSEKIKWADAIAIGPGLGRNEETQQFVSNLLQKKKDKIFIIDADAINALKNSLYKKVDLSGCVLTPHHKEFSDLLGISIDEMEHNLLDYGQKFVEETSCYLVLKGSPTIIFNPSGEIFINTSGNAGLAKFGSGDVLTGFITSFVAQQNDVEKSVIAAVYLHGLTADLIRKKESEFGITPQKLIDFLPSTIKFLRKSVV